MKLSEKVAYLKGLEEGLNLDSGKAETKLIKGIIDAFNDIVEAIDVNAADIQEMTDRVDEIDMDLGDLEAILFEGFEVEELTEEDLDTLGEELDDSFAVVYTSDPEPVDEVEEAVEEELDDAAIFAAADEVVAEAEAAEAAAEEAIEEIVEAPVEEVVEEVVVEAPVEEPVESVFEEVVEEVAAPAAAATATGIAWPEEEPPVEEAPVEEAPVEPEVVEREAEPEEDTYEVECPTCGHIMYVDESVLVQGGIECPKCHESLQFEIEYED